MKTCLWFLFLLNSCGLLAQPSASRSLSIQHGLPDYYVTGLVQDKTGFVWIATRDGLARYDGRSFKIFRYQPHSNRSLANSIIASLQLVSDSTLLIQPEHDGLQYFNPITEQFSDLLTQQQIDSQHISMPQVSLMPPGKELWGRYENRLIRYQTQSNTFSIYAFPSISLPEDVSFGNSFLLNAQRDLYAPYPGGLVVFNTQTKRFKQWKNPAIVEHGAIRNFLPTPIIQRATGELLLGGVRQLIGFNPKTGRFRAIPFPHPIDTKVGIMHTGIDGSVYFTYAMTVYRLTADDQIKPLWTASRIDYQNYFHALLLDRSGVLWVGTNGDGVQLIDLHPTPVIVRPYRTNFVHDVLTGELGIPAPDWANSIHISYRLRWGADATYATARYNKQYHLLRLNRSARTIQDLLTIPVSTRRPTHEEGNGLRVLPDGTLWMVDIFRNLLNVDTSGRILNEFALPNDRVSDIQPVGKWVWIGSEVSGLYAYDPGTRRIVRRLRYVSSDSTSLVSNHVWCLAPDPHHSAVLWVGTQDGLGRLDTRTMQFRNWTHKQGLPSATIYTLLTDRQGQLWFSTLNGISRINTRSGQLRHFTTADGLSDVAFKPFLGVQLPDGRLAFGGLTGISTFDPAALRDSTTQPISTALTALKINNVVMEPNQKGSPLTLPLPATTTLRLGPTQNFLSVEFAGLQYNKPTSLHYRYQLTGVDADWVYAGNYNVANYTQLEPGEYVFRVNTADAGGRWSPHVRTLSVVIRPPWWQTWWAYMLYAALVAGVAYALFRNYANRLRLQQSVGLKEREAGQLRELNDMKTRFFANLTHELRTPLTLILAPAERLMGEPLDAPVRRGLTTIYQNAGQLLRLINQLLDLSRLEASVMPVHESVGDLSRCVEGWLEPVAEQATAQGLSLTFDSTVWGEYWFDQEKLERIVYNLTANALKFTPAGSIGVALTNVPTDGAEGIILTVTDTGIGIPADQLPRIFDRFYQVGGGATADTVHSTGTGIGLSLVNELVGLQQGRIRVDSEAGKGTTFVVELPYRKVGSIKRDEQPVAMEHNGLTADLPAAVDEAEQPLVLIVEDHTELAGFIADSLPPAYRVCRAVDGLDGREQAFDLLPDLIISDVMMPGLDGYTLCGQLKTDLRTSHIPIILLTAKVTVENRLEGLGQGADDYLTKPFHVAELQLRVRNLLDSRRQQREWVRRRLVSAEPTNGSLQPAPVGANVGTAEDPFLIRLYALLDARLADPSLSIDTLMDELAMSRTNLHRKVKTLTGFSAGELIRTYRLNVATSLLRQGFNSSETATRVGFTSLSYFAKCFRELYGVTPSDFVRPN